MSFNVLVHRVLRQSRRPSRKSYPPKSKLRLDSLESRLTPAVGTIQFQTATSSAVESDSPSIVVTLVTDNSDLNATVSADIATTGGTATSGSDYLPFPTTTVSFSSADTFAVVGGSRVYTKSATLSLIDDQRVEGPETIKFGLSNVVLGGADGIALGSPISQTFTILDNDSATVTYAGPANVTEGGSADPTGLTATLTLNTIGTGPVGLDTQVSATVTSPTNDFTAAAVTWNAGDAADTRPVAVTAVDDQLVEAAVETLIGTPAVTTMANFNTAGTAGVNVTDNDSASVAITSPGTTTVTEDGPAANFGVTLSLHTIGTGPAQLDVPVSANLPGNADYTAAAAVFAQGSTDGATANVSVHAVDDQLVEGTETFPNEPLGVTSTANASATTSQNVVVNDNDTATVSITTPGTTTVTEGGSSANVGVTLTLNTTGAGAPALAVPVSVNLSGNADYTATQATFATGSADGATADVVVTAVDDQLVEAATETFTNQALAVTDSGGASVSATGSQTVAVNDNDSASVAITSPGTTTVTEGGPSANVGVTLTLNTSGTGPAQLDVPVTADLPGNADYTATAVTFNPGAVSDDTGNVAVTAVDDQIVEGTETFTNEPLGVTSTAIATASTSQTIVVNDNDTATVSITNPGITNVTEGGPSANVGVTLILNTPGSGGQSLGVPVSVNLPGNADYTAAAATFDAGSPNGATANVVVTAVDDQLVEAHVEAFPNQALLVTDSGGAVVTAGGSQEIDVTDNDSATVSVPTATTTVTEGQAGQPEVATLTLNTSGTGPAQLDVPVSANLPGNADYTATPVTFDVGATSGATQTITVTAVDDQLVEGTETFANQTLTLTSPAVTTADGAQTIVVLDNDTATISIPAGTTTVAEGGPSQNIVATLTLNTSGTGPAQLANSVMVNLPGNADYTAGGATFAAGTGDGATATIAVTAVDDQLVEGTETFPNQALSITAGGGGVSASGSQEIDVTDNDSASVAITSPGTTSVTEGGSSANVGVTLTLSTSGSGPASLGVPVSVNLPGNADYSAAATTFDAGATNGATANVVVTAVDDQRVEPTETFSNQDLAVTSNGGADVTASTAQTITVLDNDSATISIPTGTTGVTEGGASQTLVATLTLNTSGTGPAGLDVDISADLPGNADYTSAGVTFPANSVGGDTQTIVVTAVDDQLVEATVESFAGQDLAITANNGATAAATGTQTINVTDNDSASVAITSPGTTTVTEGGSSANVNVTLTLNTSGTGPAQLDVPVSANLPGNADYAAVATTFNPGAVDGDTANVVVTAVDDQLVEPPETFANQALGVTSAATVSATTDQTIVVNDNDSASVAITSPGTTSVTEGGPSADVGVTLTLNTSGTGPAALAVPVSVNLPGNANYTAATATFAAGSGDGATANVAVTAVDDQFVEAFIESFPDQPLAVMDSGGADVTAGTRQTINVADNDKAQLTYSGTADLTEGDATPQVVTATLSLVTSGTGPVGLDTPVSATVTSPTNDFTAATVTWNPGDTPGAKDIGVTVIDDRLVEQHVENLIGTLLPTSAAAAEATGAALVNVTDNDSANVAITSPGTTNVTEGGSSANVGVTLSLQSVGTGPIQLAVPISATLPGNADYTATPAMFAAGAADGATANVVVAAVDDNLVEAPESFANQALGVSTTASTTASGSQTVAVTDDDTATFTINDVTVGEGAGNAAFTVSLDKPIDIPFTVNVNFGGGTANPGSDYDATTQQVTFPAGSTTSQTASVPIVDDSIHEPTETFVASLSPAIALGGRSVDTSDTGTGTIIDNDNGAPTVGDRSLTLAEDTSISATLTGTDPEHDPLTFAIVTPPSHGTVNLEATTGAIIYTPAANYNGADSFTYKANDGQVDSNIGTVSITVTPVNDPPAADDGSVNTAEDTAAVGTLTATDIDSPSLTFNIVAGPSHGTISGFDPATGAFTYAPATNYNGADSFTFKANDGQLDSNVATESITVTPVNDPPVAIDASVSIAEDTTLTGSVTATDVDNDPLTYSLVGGAAHGTVTVSANGTFVYTPAANYDGSDSFTFKANDGQVDSNVATVSITVTAVNDPPVASDGTLTTAEDTPQSGTLSATDIDSPTLTYVVVSGPSHGTLTTFDASTGAFTYAPAANYNGADAFTFKANDGSLDSNVATVGITVTPVNDPPVANDASATTAEDTTLIGSVTAADVDGDALTYSSVGGAAHGTVTVSPNGTFIYVPAANFDGSDSFQFKANDGQADSNVATVSITVTPVNDPPVAGDGSLTTAEDTAATGTLSATDIDSPTLTFSVVSGPSHGTLTAFDASTGAFTYAPAANYNGADSFTFKANDGQADSNVATVSITVTPVNDPPVAANGTATTAEDTTLIGSLSATDVDSPTLTYSLVAGASHGTVTVNGNGTFVYTPAPNYNGPDSFTYKANDGQLDSSVAAVDITVTPVNDPPVASSGALTTAEDTAATGTLSATDIDSPTLTFSIVAGPSHGTLTAFDPATGAFTYTPSANYNGSDSFTFKANDGQADSNVATVSITVTPVNDPPVAANGTATTPEDTLLIGSVSATDVDSSNLTYSLVAGAAHGTVTVNSNGSYAYTPAANYNGPDSFTFKANDGQADSNVATVSITVTPVDDAPMAGNGTITTAEDTPVSGSVAATDVDGPTLTYSIVTQPGHGSVTLNGATGAFTYTPAANYNGPDAFTFKASDGSLDSNVATVVINVTPVNDAPVLTDDALVPPVLQATANPPGRRISSLFDGIVQDPDAGDTLSGIAVVGNPKNADQGTWQYSTDDGATWFDVGTVGDGPTALALSAAARLRFLPAPWFFGDPAPLTVRALDSTYAGGFTSGGTRVTVDTTTQGGSTAISAATRSVQDPVFPGDVPGAWLSTTGNLFVSGTAGKDTVAVSLVTRTVNKVKEKHVVVKLNGTVVGDFLQTAVSGRILVRGLGGNDKITVAAAITNGADLYGGTGNDTLTGGAGNDRLFGEDGNDRLIGGKGNDLLDGGSGNDILSDAAGTNVLIGGSGADKLTGGSGEDLFIAGSTDLDANLTDLTGLDNVMAEWTSGDTYANRVAHLQGTLTGGRNSTTVLTSATVHDDQGAKDSLIGGKGNDWFLISVPDTVTGAAAGETKTTI